MAETFICDAIRTPFGHYAGALVCADGVIGMEAVKTSARLLKA